jgi:hypothetical protein
LGEIGTTPIMMIYISSEPDFHRDSESEVRNLKFHLCPMFPRLADCFPISLSDVSNTVKCFL